MKKLIILLSLLCAFAISGTANAMSITAMDSAANMAQALVGSGVTISNASYSGATGASGYFKGGTASGLGFDSGIVLTSGSAMNLNGTKNTSDYISTANGTPGDADLSSLINNQKTNDAAVLKFDFVVSTGTSIYFNYVFGSDEYNEYVNSFNDVFGFFVDGKNIALIPGTTTPVSINNVNKNVNSQYYNNNDPSDFPNGTPYAFEYDGFTDVFTASLTGLVAGKTYTIKLAVADALDQALDSGVFLQAETFSNKPPTNPVPEPGTILLIGLGLLGFITHKKGQKK